MWHLSFKNHLRMTSVLPFLGYVSKRQHGIALNGICSRFEDTLPLCVCTTPAPNFCLLQRFVLIYLFPPGRSFNFFCWPKAWVIQVALSVTVCPHDVAMCAVVRAHRISCQLNSPYFAVHSSWVHRDEEPYGKKMLQMRRDAVFMHN